MRNVSPVGGSKMSNGRKLWVLGTWGEKNACRHPETLPTELRFLSTAATHGHSAVGAACGEDGGPQGREVSLSGLPSNPHPR